MQRFAHKVIEEDAPSVRLEFDQALLRDLGAVYDAIDSALDAEIAEDAQLSAWAAQDLKRKAFVLAAFRKVINDLLGCVENLRAGYFDLCQSILRSALEGFCTAVLIDVDKQTFDDYHDGKFSVNKAVKRFAHRKDLVKSEAGEQLLRVYDRLHKMAHPTIVALAVQFPPAGGNFPIGGAFYRERLPTYRSVTNEMRDLARNIEGYLRTRYSKERPLTQREDAGGSAPPNDPS
ncbi:MAG: hypothetical protein A2218_07815 [Elusimicrobia bacterium RIFOXYA2_FULL_53_38]|nr:MAG: hypothetical protein A2218_07815 [Elusimicrobia bacterium RIFOXYA2_FULL_53_38]